ncbi:MAG: GNAT family N-acetyltransferase [Hyphomicrobiales bacterium]
MPPLEPRAILATKGDLAVRLAGGADEIAEAQKLRYRVFYEELNARPDAAAAAARLDADRFDGFCDHLIVTHGPDLVGTYRLLRQEVAEANGGFYTQDEFDMAPLIAAHPGLRFLELGRSCVLKPFRTRPVVELLWQGIWNYVRRHRFDVMLGCASLEGTDPDRHAATLTFLARNCAAPHEWRVRALAHRYVEMKRLPAARVDPKAALKALPPLIKGYLRLGCYIGEGAVIDEQFNTIDVLIVLPVSAIDARYFVHFGQPNG